MNDVEYEKVAPVEPIRIERHGCMNWYIDATGFCYALHHIGFDEEIARRNIMEASAQPTTHAAQKFCSWLWKRIVGKTFGHA